METGQAGVQRKGDIACHIEANKERPAEHRGNGAMGVGSLAGDVGIAVDIDWASSAGVAST